MFQVDIDKARELYPEWTFVAALTPSAQKAAFRVQDLLGNDLCLKLISPDFITDRLSRELESLQRIEHPNVVRLLHYKHEIGPAGARHYILEDYIPGQDLTEWVKTSSGNFDEIADVFAQICDGLEALRANQIVHRDLKPANIRLRDDGTPIIIDFGLARVLDQPDLTATADGARIGTPLYFSPEQFQGIKRDIDHRTDLFALGIMLYEACTGMHPFYSGRMTLDQLQHGTCETAPLMNQRFDDLPCELQRLILRLLEKKRIRRPPNAAMVASTLRNMVVS